MKKIAKFLVIGLFSFQFTSAAGLMLGVEGAISPNNTISSDKNKFEDLKGSSEEVSLKVGQYFDSFRWYFQFGHNTEVKDKGFKWSSNTLLFDLDWTPQLNNNFNFMLGFYTGAIFTSFNYKNGEDVKVRYRENFYSYYEANLSDDLDVMPVIGGKLGTIYTLDNHNTIEFGVKADGAFKWLYGDSKKLDTFTNTKTSFFAGYTYKF